MQARRRGFTLVELMVTLAVIGVLVAVALPSYTQYVRKATYSELLSYAAPLKTAISECFVVQGVQSKCNTPELLGIDLQPSPNAKMALSIDPVSLAIHMEPRALKGIDPLTTCELRPSFGRRNNLESWNYVATAPCVLAGYVRL